ncbi:MAG: NAD(P)/FAD-dependent oxidoreductase [Vicinamibacterales bacterium]
MPAADSDAIRSLRRCRRPGPAVAGRRPVYTPPVTAPTTGEPGRAYDVIIAGGGLAGHCLARQLQSEHADLRVAVIEKRTYPVPEAAFKVGESTVEIGAHYFSHVLALESHCDDEQLEKLGIRYFFTAGDNRDITARVELGPVSFPPVRSYQIDRGRLENTLARLNREAGIDVIEGTQVRDIRLSPAGHEVTLERRGATSEIAGRWFVDATGRAATVKRRLGLRRDVRHHCNAVWFRVRERLRVDDWSTDPAWRARVPTGLRWLSTNHLMGKGYWVWLIPLASGSTSVGIVADAAIHPFASMNRLERAMAWLRRFEPQCADTIAACEDRIEDFLALSHYAYASDRVFSPERWCLTGDAGVFTDPLYSPGSDFIGIANDMICELVSLDRRGGDVASAAEGFNRYYLLMFQAVLRVYEGQYSIMGNGRVMSAKVCWDNASYWSVTAPLYFHRKYRDLPFLESVEHVMRRFFIVHARMQTFLRRWDQRTHPEYRHAFLNLLDIDFMAPLQAALLVHDDDEALRARLDRNVTDLERRALDFFALADTAEDDGASAEDRRLVPMFRRRFGPPNLPDHSSATSVLNS